MNKNNFFLSIGAGVVIIYILSLFRKSSKSIRFYNTRRNGAYATRPLSGVIEITQHHTATGTDWTPGRIAAIHTDKNGWPGIGYHYLVYNDGTIFQVNDLKTSSYHNGVNNSQAIGIAWVGDGTKEKPSSKAMDSIFFLYRKLKKEIPSIKYLRGHNEKKATTCPGPLINMDRLRLVSGLKA